MKPRRGYSALATQFRDKGWNLIPHITKPRGSGSSDRVDDSKPSSRGCDFKLLELLSLGLILTNSGRRSRFPSTSTWVWCSLVGTGSEVDMR